MNLASAWVRTNDPVIKSPPRYLWTTAPGYNTYGRKSLKYCIMGQSRATVLNCRALAPGFASGIVWSACLHAPFFDLA